MGFGDTTTSANKARKEARHDVHSWTSLGTPSQQLSKRKAVIWALSSVVESKPSHPRPYRTIVPSPKEQVPTLPGGRKQHCLSEVAPLLSLKCLREPLPALQALCCIIDFPENLP